MTDRRALREAFGSFMTGVTVVSAMGSDGHPRGFTANSFASVSLDPPLLLVCIAKSSGSADLFRSGSGFAVNVLSEDQREVAMTFARPTADRFARFAWRRGPVGSPVLADVAAWFDCLRHDVVDAGDHHVLIGRVEAFEATGRGGLGFARGGYFTQRLSDLAIAAAQAPSLKIGAVIEGDEGVLLCRSPSGFTLPRAPVPARRAPDLALHDLAAGMGLSLSFAVPFAVYKAAGVQHIVYRSAAFGQPPSAGRFTQLATIPDDLIDPSDLAMLRRFDRERRSGQFGIYLSDGQGAALGSSAPSPPG